ncbi:cysteine proteinase-like [Ostrinia furnacalis]|uniref:cysteine proteinase-like n=1 Tax=Ostrinia furnacalis TaxID=93504 RepID=UPI001038A26A|nr:cysteine proteinase-like [Ostrinia furnacalis]
MKVYSVVALFSIATICVLADPSIYYNVNDAPQLFHKFIKQYGREYKDYNDYLIHYQAFVETLIRINQSNAASTSAYFGINEFSDYTKEQKKHHLGAVPY